MQKKIIAGVMNGRDGVAASDQIDTLFRTGTTYLDAGDLDEAIEVFSEVLRLDPQNASALYNRANAKMFSHDLNGAEVDYLSALAIAPEDFQTNINLSIVYMQKGKFKDAIELQTNMIDLGERTEDHFLAYFSRAQAKSQLGTCTEDDIMTDLMYACNYGWGGFQERQAVVTYLCQSAMQHLEDENYAQAALFYQNLVDNGVEGPVECVNCGAALAGLGKKEEALKYYKMAFGHDPAKMARIKNALENNMIAYASFEDIMDNTISYRSL